MQNKYKVKFTPVAEDDLDKIYQYISEKLDAPEAAMNLMNEIENKVMRLADMPYSCVAVDDELLKSKGYRKLIIKNFLALYVVFEDEKLVKIMRVVYGASNYKKNI